LAFTPNFLSNFFSSSAVGAVNDNLNKIKAEFLTLIKRDGSTTMLDNLDMDSNRIINHGAPVDDNDLARLIDVKSVPKGEKGDPGENAGAGYFDDGAWAPVPTTFIDDGVWG